MHDFITCVHLRINKYTIDSPVYNRINFLFDFILLEKSGDLADVGVPTESNLVNGEEVSVEEDKG